MRAVIIAGGKGSRVSDIYPYLPKPMFPFRGKPLLQWQIESLASQGIAEITLLLGYGAVDHRFHKDKQAEVTLFVHPNGHPQDSDIIVADAENRVVAWKSKNDNVKDMERRIG
jgi:NDP-sugar pyrophosphorylase family protein